MVKRKNIHRSNRRSTKRRSTNRKLTNRKLTNRRSTKQYKKHSNLIGGGTLRGPKIKVRARNFSGYDVKRFDYFLKSEGLTFMGYTNSHVLALTIDAARRIHKLNKVTELRKQLLPAANNYVTMLYSLDKHLSENDYDTMFFQVNQALELYETTKEFLPPAWVGKYLNMVRKSFEELHTKVKSFCDKFLDLQASLDDVKYDFPKLEQCGEGPGWGRRLKRKLSGNKGKAGQAEQVSNKGHTDVPMPVLHPVVNDPTQKPVMVLGEVPHSKGNPEA